MPIASGAAVTVILASHGYPQSPRPGDVITGLGHDGQLAFAMEGVTVFHAGTRVDDDGHFVTAGGRVLAVTGVGATLAEARRRAYEGAALITFEGRVMRSDIALAVA
jgi:phosphoribosylamine--glycine ligase